MAEPALAYAHPGTVSVPLGEFPVSAVRQMLGDESAYCVILWNDMVSDARAAEIARVFPEAKIWRVNREDRSSATVVKVNHYLRGPVFIAAGLV
jgi:hypothetical protein